MYTEKKKKEEEEEEEKDGYSVTALKLNCKYVLTNTAMNRRLPFERNWLKIEKDEKGLTMSS